MNRRTISELMRRWSALSEIYRSERLEVKAAWLAEVDRRKSADATEPTPDEEWAAFRARILNSSSSGGG